MAGMISVMALAAAARAALTVGWFSADPEIHPGDVGNDRDLAGSTDGDRVRGRVGRGRCRGAGPAWRAWPRGDDARPSPPAARVRTDECIGSPASGQPRKKRPCPA